MRIAEAAPRLPFQLRQCVFQRTDHVGRKLVIMIHEKTRHCRRDGESRRNRHPPPAHECETEPLGPSEGCRVGCPGVCKRQSIRHACFGFHGTHPFNAVKRVHRLRFGFRYNPFYCQSGKEPRPPLQPSRYGTLHIYSNDTARVKLHYHSYNDSISRRYYRREGSAEV